MTSIFSRFLYNLMQVIKAYVAEGGKVLARVVSMHYLFDDVCKELQAWAYHTNGNWPRMKRDAVQMRLRLRALLKGSWNAIKYTKASDKKPRGKPPDKLRLHGGHTSMHRVLQGTAKVVTIRTKERGRSAPTLSLKGRGSRSCQRHVWRTPCRAKREIILLLHGECICDIVCMQRADCAEFSVQT